MIWTHALAILGLVIFAAGLRIGARSVAGGLGGLARTMFLARGLRHAIFGLCTFAVALGTACGSSATVGVALVILGEEMLEIATVVAALRWGGEGRSSPVLSTRLSLSSSRDRGSNGRVYPPPNFSGIHFPSRSRSVSPACVSR